MAGWMNGLLGALLGQRAQPDADVREILGVRVEVLNTRADVDTERVFRRAEAVLALVRKYQPWRFAQLGRDVSYITVQRYPTRGAWLSESRACLLELTFMANESFSDAQVAASLVHEATHARLDGLVERYGITSYSAAPARHERICRRAELSFGLAVPDGAPVVQRALESLAMADQEVAPAIDWAEAGRRVAAVDRSSADSSPMNRAR